MTVQETIHLAPRGLEFELVAEMETTGAVRELGPRLYASTLRESVWAQQSWMNPVTLTFDSISEAAKKLKSIQRNWCLYPTRLHRRAQLIQDQLPKIRYKPSLFTSTLPTAPLGSWSLLDAHTLLASSQCLSPFPNGEVEFQEDKKTPPNRAYLKLWEAFYRMQRWPQKGERCVDLGSSPGGWTWVLQKCGAEVISVDKAPLDSKIARLPGVSFHQQSVFALDPKEFGSVDWLVCDVICYPDRLYDLIQKWLASGMVKHMVCTLKFQDHADMDTVKKFQSLPRAQLVHLFHNKHELTFMATDLR